ncbi:hypothetical protein MKW92_007455, partial [Papaver armeniacum]
VIVQGPGSWPRYGHVMALLGQRFLLAIGGNDGKATLVTVEDLFYSQCPLQSVVITWGLYAAAGARSDDLLFLCERRGANNVGIVNAWIHDSGGALGGGRLVEDSSSVAGGLIATAVSLRLVRQVVREQHCKDYCMVIITIYMRRM